MFKQTEPVRYRKYSFARRAALSLLGAWGNNGTKGGKWGAFVRCQLGREAASCKFSGALAAPDSPEAWTPS